MTDDELRAELLRRQEVDQEIRRRVTAEPRTEEMMTRWQEIDRDNTAWLWSVVRERGWPPASQVGEDGAHAAWLLAQHAGDSPRIQERFLAMLADAVARREASPGDLAYLEDRVRVIANRPQLYGTQFVRDAHGLRPQRIADPDHLDERRTAVGLRPFAEYERLMRERDEGDRRG